MLVHHACEGAALIYYLDCLPVFDTYNKGMSRAILSKDADLFLAIFTTVREKNLDLIVKWLPSHLNDPEKRNKLKIPVPDWVTDFHIAGNQSADDAAAVCARYNQIPEHVAKPVLHRLNQIQQIQKRLSAVGLAFERQTNKPNEPQQPTLLPSVDQLVLKSKHNILVSIDDNQLVCTRCVRSISHKAPQLRHFLEGPCIEPHSLFSPISLGSQVSHHSHRIVMYGGVYLCKKCGATGKLKFKLLSKACAPPQTAGQRNVKAFFDGKKLPTYPGWPFTRPAIPFQHKQTRADVLTVERIQQQVAAFTSTAVPIATDIISNPDDVWSSPPSASGTESD